MKEAEEKILLSRPDLILKDIPHKGGCGSEADVGLYVRNFFPGMGGTIVTERNILTAFRRELNGHIPGTALRTFLLHAILKKLDDYFCSPKIRRYLNSHIPTPYGHIGINEGFPFEAYLYQWVRGGEGFVWTYRTLEGVKGVELNEWREFTNAFHAAGVDMQSDITDPDNGFISKNIIHETGIIHEYTLDLCWSRIDFGSRSLIVKPDKLKTFFEQNADQLIRVLGRGKPDVGINRYNFLLCAHQWIFENAKKEKDAAYLEYLARDFRLSALEEPKVSEILLNTE